MLREGAHKTKVKLLRQNKSNSTHLAHEFADNRHLRRRELLPVRRPLLRRLTRLQPVLRGARRPQLHAEDLHVELDPLLRDVGNVGGQVGDVGHALLRHVRHVGRGLLRDARDVGGQVGDAGHALLRYVGDIARQVRDVRHICHGVQKLFPGPAAERGGYPLRRLRSRNVRIGLMGARTRVNGQKKSESCYSVYVQYM